MNNYLGGLLIFWMAQALVTAQSDSIPFNIVRYEEDWSFLADSVDLDWYEHLKYIPLGGQAFLSFGGEARYLYESYDNLLWQDLPYDGYLLQRYHLHADLWLSGGLRLFTQLGSALEDGRNQGPRPIDEDKAFMHQAFVEYHPFRTVELRVGRQEISLGSVRLFTVREGPNVRLSHDAIRIDAYPTEHLTVSALLGRPVMNTPAGFDNELLQDGETFWGLYNSYQTPKTGTFDAYYLAQRTGRRTYTEDSGEETRHIIGLRHHGEAANWSWDNEAMYQFGNLGATELSAYTVSLWGGYTFNELPLRPYLGAKTEIISGDRDLDDGRLGTFRTFYAKPAYFGFSSLIGPSNLLDVHPILRLHLSLTLSLSVETTFFWRQSTVDALYDINGRIVREATNDERYVGAMPIGLLAWQPLSRVQVIGSYNRFFAGDFITASGGRDFDYVYAFIKFIF